MALGENMRFLREEHGYSLKDVELQTGINNGNLSRYERNLNYPSIELCIRLADLYQVSLDELVGRTEKTVYPASPHLNSYTTEEQQLIEDFRSLTPPLRQMLQDTIQTWKSTEREIQRRNKTDERA